MDNKTIITGDNVYDINYGNGVVIKVAAGRVVVAFEQMQQFYDVFGKNISWGKRTLFWSEPIIIAPSPDKKKNAILMDAISSTESLVNKTWQTATGT